MKRLPVLAEPPGSVVCETFEPTPGRWCHVIGAGDALFLLTTPYHGTFGVVDARGFYRGEEPPAKIWPPTRAELPRTCSGLVAEDLQCP